MTATSATDVERALEPCCDPFTGRALLRDATLERIENDAGVLRIGLRLAYPAAGGREAIARVVREQLEALPGVNAVEVEIDWRVRAHPVAQGLPNMQQVKNIIAVASGKGGVGKSTTAVNLALGLLQEGARVGLLDADIYGPSQPLMLGIPDGQRPDQRGARMLEPVPAHGLQTMSIGYLVTERTPMVWRGPMVSSALEQMLNQTAWDDLDYLVIDLPPGTGDIQLTLSQKVPVAGAVIITTPQDIALLDARKGIEMFRKVSVPVLGIIENMALHICSECGHREHLFGEGGGERIAAEYGIDLLGSLPLSRTIREQVDGGRPSVVAEPEGQAAGLYREIARRTAARLASLAGEGVAMPEISISDD